MKKILEKVAIFVLAASIGAFAFAPARAGEEAPRTRQLAVTAADKVMVHELLTWIVDNSKGKYTMPKVEPRVLRLSLYAMSEVVCFGAQPCRAYGLHHVGSYVVIALSGLKPEDDRHVLVHELVHFLQSRAAEGTLGNCMSDYQDELEAYRTQYKYRMVVQGYVGPSFAPPGPCVDDE